MTVAAVVYCLSVVIFVCGIAFSPDHTFKGAFAAATFFALLVSGLALAVNAL